MRSNFAYVKELNPVKIQVFGEEELRIAGGVSTVNLDDKVLIYWVGSTPYILGKILY